MVKKEMYLIIIIIVLLILLFNSYFISKNTCIQINNSKGLLSPRVYSGLLSAESHLILNFEPLKINLHTYLTTNNINASIYILNLRDGANLGIDENNPFPAISFNKLPAAIIILKKVQEGLLKLDTNLPILPENRDSGSGTLYASSVQKLSVGELLKYMLQESDNTAFWVLSTQIYLDEGQKLMNYMNYYKNSIDSLTESPADFQISPKTTANLFISLYLSTILKPEYSEMILQLLTNTSFDIKKYANLPDNVIVSQKYGSFHYNEDFFHSCGIMYTEDSRIFYCIMTKNFEKEPAQKVVGTIVNKIYNYVLETKKLTVDF